MPFDFSVPIQYHGLLSTVGFRDVVDILLVAVILYKSYEMLKDTRAITLAKGMFVMMGVALGAYILELHAIYWLLSKSIYLLFMALPIVFQPELRRALERIGQGKFLGSAVYLNAEEADTLVNEIDKVVFNMSAKKIGALIVLEREIGINEIIDTGIRVDGLVTAPFMMNVFIPNTPLHDGAAVIRGNRMIAAGCLLPLTENRGLSTELGTRHRAALGLSEQCDAVVVIVSEETGIVSIAENGHITRRLNSEQLKKRLRPLLIKADPTLKMKDIKNAFDTWRKNK
ncbi:MAG: diadenylate cyclase CdaA [Selenomonadaceae bacterium]|uniref:diadenylate cyclase CdaA n=1 Tax=Anaerovibrio slackiae TaxID=2652309 RepID=UPI0038690E04|nr:diadenylate cyclase CdaA [Selenomonadaceae bacterium]MBQ2411481.1 diadenylate cyclase CdaA [Selenomonadaceae bacterium]MBQ5584831.1 diadenylate cyclase CdaA [Selenomonadaceae bacterium]MBQ5652000.1 diadenylate cyclase CdaA [Selenomonadaceae bacterium]MBQ5845828.1 diadenylate cyclase CdaA [Selenomonadaceae bacterium]